MTVLVSIETVLLVLLVVLVAGLLRSHAEILRRLGPGEQDEARDRAAARGAGERRGAGAAGGVAGGAGDGVGDRLTAVEPGLPEPPPGARVGAALRAAPLVGVTPTGDPVTLAFDGPASMPTLLAFLTSGCSTCAGFWETLAEPRLPAGVQTVIVTHGSERERPAKLRALEPDGVAVVMSSEAWRDYGVPGSPYFVLVDGGVLGEGVATTWDALSSLVRDAIEDQAAAEAEGHPGAVAGGVDRGAGAGSRRAGTIDATLAAAGIGPEHPSLYPGRKP
jgi:hypothetical protein